MMAVLLSSCQQRVLMPQDSGYVIEVGDDLYYYDFDFDEPSYALYKSDKNGGNRVKISNIDGIHYTPMFLINDRLYYAYGAWGADSFKIFSLSLDSGEIEEFAEVSDIITETDGVHHTFDIFTCGRDMYVYVNSNIHKITGGKDIVVAEYIASFFVDGNDIYYSIYDGYEYSPENSGTIHLYRNGKSETIFNVEDLTEDSYIISVTPPGTPKNINHITKSGDELYFVTSDTLWYQGALYKLNLSDPINTVKKLNEEETIRNATNDYELYGDTVYYKFQSELKYAKDDVITGTGIRKIDYYDICGDRLYYLQIISDTETAFCYMPLSDEGPGEPVCIE